MGEQPKPLPNTGVSSIQIRSGDWVDSIRLTYRDGTVRTYGKQTGTLCEEMVLGEDERITGIRFKQGQQHLKELQVITNRRRSIEYGRGDPKRDWEALEGSESNPIVDLVSADADGMCPRIEGGVRLDGFVVEPPGMQIEGWRVA